MTLLDEPPTAVAPPAPTEPVRRSPVGSWRFATRLARREVRRRAGRTVLAALLIAVPVVAMTVGSIIARTNADDWTADFERDYGDTDIVLNGLGFAWEAAGASDDAVPSPLPEGAVVREYVWSGTAITSVEPYDDNTLWFVQFGNLSFDDPGAAAGIDIVEGRAPVDGEILLGRDIAKKLGVAVGDDLTLARPSGTWTVAGLGAVRGNYRTDPVVVPGFDPDRFAPDYGAPMTLIDLPADTPVDTVRRLAAERNGITRYDDPWYDPTSLGAGMAWGYVGGVLALIVVGIIVAAAFATSARRQLVTIGQLTANGAPEPVVRRTLALQGTWTGFVGAAVGLAVGLAALPFTRSIMAEYIVGHEIRAFRFSALDLVVVAVTAIVAATIAAGVPARSAARVPVMAALAGRRPAGAPAAWLVPTGLALSAGGLGLVAVAALGAKNDEGVSNNVWAFLVVVGITALVFGTCCAAPLVVERIGRLGRRASLSWRLALRSLARSRSRSAAVVAAIAVAVGGATSVAALADVAMADDRCCPPTLPADAVVVLSVPVLSAESDAGRMVDYGPFADRELGTDATSALEAIVPDADVVPYEIATFDPAPFDPDVDYNWPGGPLVATPALLDLLGVSAADRATLADVGALQPGMVGGYDSYFGASDDPSLLDEQLTVEYRAEDGTISVPYAIADDPIEFAGTGELMITADAARDAGFEVVHTGVIVRTGAPLTPSQLDDLAALQQQLYGTPLDAFIEPGDPPRSETSNRSGTLADEYVEIRYEDPRWNSSSASDVWLARLVIVGAALGLSMLVVSIGLSLAAAEGRDERDVFAVIGARPSSMRRQAAARAAVLSLVGIGLGIPLGFVPTWVIDRVVHDGDGSVTPVSVPWPVVASLVVVIPVVAAGAAWIASGLGQRLRPPSPTRRD